MARTVNVRDVAGSLLLDLSSGGYEVDFDGVRYGPTVWNRSTSTSPWVDGRSLDVASKDSRSLELTLRVLGADNGQVGSRLQALVDAVEQPAWVLEVVVDSESTSWRAECADSEWSPLTVEMDNLFRTVTLTVPVQPSPSISGVG